MDAAKEQVLYEMSVRRHKHTKFDLRRCFNSKCLWFSGEKYMNNLTKCERLDAIKLAILVRNIGPKQGHKVMFYGEKTYENLKTCLR